MATQVSNAATDDNLVDARITGYGMAYAYTVLFSAALTVLKELTPPLLNLMKALGHHWVTQGGLNLIVFFVLAAMLARSGRQMEGGRLAFWIAGSTVVGALIIFGFYLVEL
uniref:hypothetical protein n=1 Tax=Pararhizobium sp. IMCC3301 TaxID=3067904 RepID=UPI002741CD15|nr:hypothetical protein [Pararhizobium sp. IMCC3301]